MVGAPSQLELFDYKPELEKLHNKPCPESLIKGKQFAFIEGIPNMLGLKLLFLEKESLEIGFQTIFHTLKISLMK